MASPSITPHTSPEFTGPKYGWHECVESLERYGPGGYHPVHLGDKFSNGRYEVIHKLGYGGYSTVWLCKDLQQQRYVSVKIAVSELPDEEHSEMYEVDVYHALRNGDEKHPGKRFVVSFLDDFVHQGPNGSHQCFVFPVAMNNVASAKNASIDNSRMFPPQIARSIAMQSLLGLSYIHACGVVHTDLHTKNILIKASSHKSWPLAKPYERPRELKVRRNDGAPLGNDVPRYQIYVADTFMPSDTAPTNCQVMISDFGEAYFSKDHERQSRKTALNTPMLVRPPDTILGHPITEAVDSWTMGMTIIDILGRGKLFEDLWPDEDTIILESISTLGPLPTEMWHAWVNRSNYFKDDGSSVKEGGALNNTSKPLTVRLRENIETKPEATPLVYSEEELQSLETTLRSMLHYEPNKRMTVDQALKSKWVQNYGIPALLECIPDLNEKYLHYKDINH